MQFLMNIGEFLFNLDQIWQILVDSSWFLRILHYKGKNGGFSRGVTLKFVEFAPLGADSPCFEESGGISWIFKFSWSDI